MQRYRVNYLLLFGTLFGSVLVGAVAFFLVHPWQVNRKATWFLKSAEQALSEGDLRTALDYQGKYVQYRKDEDDARIKLAHLAVDVSGLDDAGRNDHAKAYRLLEDTVRRTNDPELRRELADLLISFGRPQDALVHIEELQAGDPDSTELQALRVRALFLTKDFRRASELALGLIGYDKKSKEFDAKKGFASDQPEIYSLLASVLQNKSSTRDLARRVVDQMVEVNPESHDAYLKLSNFLYQIGEKEEGGVALEKAYELSPTDSDVLQRKGQVALSEKDFDAAKGFFSAALDLYPDKLQFYQLLARTETLSNQLEEALAILDRGIEHAGHRNSGQLLLFKIDLLFATKDIAAIGKEIDALEDLKGPQNSALQPIIDYGKSRIKYLEQKWAEAAKDLERVRPLLFNSPNEQAVAGNLLGSCYEQLGKLDLAFKAYDLVLQSLPKYKPALAGRRRVYARLHPGETGDQGFSLRKLVKDMVDLPDDQQDWKKVDDAITAFAEESNLSEARTALQRAQVFLEREMFPQAEKLVQAAAELEPDNVGVRFAAVKLLLRKPGGGPEKALKLLDRTVEKFGVSLDSRMVRIETLLKLSHDDAAERLSALTEGTEEWTSAEKVRFFSSLGMAFRRLGVPGKAIEYWKTAAGFAPNSLPIRMHLFELTLQQRDKDAIKDAQQKILDLVKDKNDASYVLTEVKRRLLGYRLEEVSREELLEARVMLEAALKRRSEWSDLHILYGQLLIVLNEDMGLALQHLDDALKYGRANVNALALQVNLLAKRGMHQEALEKMNLIAEESRTRLLGQVEAEVLLATGDSETAYQVAQEIAEAQPEVAKTQKWFASMARKAGQLDTAAAAYHTVTELSPADSEAWSQLLAIHAAQKNPQELEKVFREAQLALESEFLPSLAAKSFELRGRWKNAERIYLATYADQLEEISIARRMADFYLLWSKADPANRLKAGSFINRILKATYDGRIPANHPQAAWARLQAARQLASTGRYQDALKAQQLLTQASGGSKLTVADQAVLAEILASLKDPVSQGKAIRLLTELYENQHLKKEGILLLANLLRNANQWQRCEDLMLDTLSKSNTDPQIWATYIGMLIDRGEYTDAQNRISRMKKLGSDSSAYLPLLATLAAKKGDQALVRKTLNSLLPSKLSGSLSPEELQAIRKVAYLATKCDDLELAKKLFGLYVQRTPQAGFELVRFHAMHGDAEKALAALKKDFSNHIDQHLAVASQMLRARRSEYGEKLDADVSQMVSIALRDDPDSAQRQLFKAEVLEIQQKYQESADAYDELLSRDDAPERVRAAAMNNLAFLLALMGQRLDDAEKLVNQSMETFGPIDDLLDTRALVRMAAKKYDLALEDLTLAVSIGRDPIKYYHLAQTQFLAGDQKAAIKSWKEALKLGLTKEKLPILEQKGYEEFQAKISSIEAT